MNKTIKPLSIAIFIIISIFNFIRIDSVSHSASDTIRPFILQTAALALIFFLLFQLLKRVTKA